VAGLDGNDHPSTILTARSAPHAEGLGESVAPGVVRRDVGGLSEQRSEDAQDAEEDDDPDDDDADQKEDQKPEAAAVALSYYDHLWWRRGCLAHSGISLGVCRGSSCGSALFRCELACHLIFADGHHGQSVASAGIFATARICVGVQFSAVSAPARDRAPLPCIWPEHSP
jgi:hypothetical protein